MAGHDLKGHFDGSDPAPPFPTYSTADESRWTAVDKDKSQAYLPLTKNGSMTSMLHVPTRTGCLRLTPDPDTTRQHCG